MSAAVAIILDMDGLMLDTEPISLRVWREAANALGYILDDETCSLMIGQSQVSNREMLVRRLGRECPIDELVASAQRRYRQTLEQGGVPLKSGLIEFLGFLEERRLPRAVATSTDTELAVYKLRQAGVLGHFDIVVGGDQVTRGKPSPDIFLEAASRLGRPPAECLVLEDSDPGVRAAAAAGMRAILVPDARTPSAEVRSLAYAVADSLDDAREIIVRLTQE